MLTLNFMYKKITFLVLSILVLGIAYYGISPIFKNTSLDDPIPKSIAPAAAKETLGQVQSTSTTNNKIVPKVAKKEAGFSTVRGTSGHPASGTVQVITSENTKIIRYENFKTINGPDLYVYLSKDLQAKDFVDLGKIKATEGNINYEVPKNIDIKNYSYVIVWCKTFGVLFNSADISKYTE